jgi:predicted MFS family arabinose efflux permease
MGIIGVSIGLAFVLAIVLSAPLAAISGLSGLFGLTAALALGAIARLGIVVPVPARRRAPAAAHLPAVLRMLVTPQLLVLNASVFMMHAMLTACFVALPLMLIRDNGLALDRQWELYLPVMLASAVVMGVVLRRVTSVRGSMTLVLVCAAGLGVSVCGFAGGGHDTLLLWAAAIVFFSGFNLLEATLPSLVSRLAPAHMRGAALGAYATAQFLGAGVGGILGGMVLQHFDVSGVFVAAAVLVLAWVPLLVWGRPRVVAAGHPAAA